MFGRDGLMGALMGAVVVGSVIGVTSSAMRRRNQANALQPGVVPAGPVRLPPTRFNRMPPPAPPPPVAAPAPHSDLVTQLEQLGKLHGAGVLTDEEFAQAKQKLLRG